MSLSFPPRKLLLKRMAYGLTTRLWFDTGVLNDVDPTNIVFKVDIGEDGRKKLVPKIVDLDSPESFDERASAGELVAQVTASVDTSNFIFESIIDESIHKAVKEGRTIDQGRHEGRTLLQTALKDLKEMKRVEPLSPLGGVINGLGKYIDPQVACGIIYFRRIYINI